MGDSVSCSGAMSVRYGRSVSRITGDIISDIPKAYGTSQSRLKNTNNSWVIANKRRVSESVSTTAALEVFGDSGKQHKSYSWGNIW